MTPPQIFVDNLATIEFVAARVSRRYRVSQSEVDDFASTVTIHLLASDCRILRAFKGRSSMATYLTSVISNLCIDDRTRRWGRWRPSRRASSHGHAATAMERLIQRDGYSEAEAAQALLTSGMATKADIGEAHRRLRASPSRKAWHVAPSPVAVCAIDPILDREDAECIRRTLGSTIASLGSEEKLILELHFGEGVPLTSVGIQLGISRATVMRRMAKVLADCRMASRSCGLTADRIVALVRSGDASLPLFENLGP